MAHVHVEVTDPRLLTGLFGHLDAHQKQLETLTNTRLHLQDEGILIEGEEEEVHFAKTLIEELIEVLKIQKRLDERDIAYAFECTQRGEGSLRQILEEIVVTTAMGRPIRAKTLGQKRYLDAIKDHDVVFGIGPAGTGKTYLAMACAVKAFKAREVQRIILTRPAVEAGESLGFLPGDLQMKVDPYLRPLYDALFDILGAESYQKCLEKGLIEVAPLAYMRGRTLDGAYVILDEAQNTTREQMKMFLTRLGYGSKAIITGDVTQIDLPRGKQSGLKSVLKILDGVKGIDVVRLGRGDIVRHPLVQRIIEAYERYEKKDQEDREKGEAHDPEAPSS